MSARKGDIDSMQMLLAKGADVNLQDNNGITSLMWAAIYGQKKIVKVLLKKGADVNAFNHAGETALTWATLVGNSEIVEILKQYGAKELSSVPINSELSKF